MEEKKGFFSRLMEWGPIAAIVDSIRNKLLTSHMALALIPLIVLTVVTYLVASNSLRTKAFDNLRSVGVIKVKNIENYFAERQGDMQVLSNMADTLRQDAFTKLAAVHEIKKDQVNSFFDERLGDVSVLATNPTVAEALQAFEDDPGAIGGSSWLEVEKVYGPWLVQYREAYGYYDLFLISTSGEVVYTVAKESDFGQNLKTGSLKDSPAAKAFQGGLTALTFQDYERYAPSNDDPACFIAAPIKSGSRTLGVVMVQVSIDAINAMMVARVGLGETGETYLVGPDKFFRTDSRFVEESTILNPNYTVDTTAANASLAGAEGADIIRDYRGEYVLSAYGPVTIAGTTWALLSEIDVAEAFAPKVEGAEKDFFTQYKEDYGYYDIFLFTTDGYLFYTVAHEADYQTNLLTGPYKDSNLGTLVTKILNDPKYQVVDFEKYAPSQDAPASFVGAPVFYKDEVILVVAAQLSLDQINGVMVERTGLGETGESYLVGQDNLFRTESRFVDQMGVDTAILNPDVKADTTATRGALAGGSGLQIIDDYRGEPVLSYWEPLVLAEPDAQDPDGIVWAVMSEIDQAEVNKPIVTMALVSAGLFVGAAILVVIVALVLSGGLTRQVNHIMAMFSQIGIGDFAARAEVTSRDELGTMAYSLNAMLDNTLTLIQSREERDAIQESIMSLLDDVSGVAEGDLSQEAEVTADIMGAVADSFNYMIDQLRAIVTGVQDATLQVSSSANEIQTTAEHLAQGSESQAMQISDTAAAIEEMAVSIQQVSENAALSATVGEQATANARQGAKAVQNTIEGMTRIREQVQETAKRIKRLGESSQEIGEIVQLINDIADRTSILALNASIQAAMAGEAGRGFAVVAEEVERLAERSTEATKQIANLVRTIQGETTEAVAAMESTTREVVSGSELANQAGQALVEIEGVSSRLAELIQSISLASKQQARGSEALAKSMDDISEVTQQTAAGTKQAAVSINNLAMLADELRGSVSRFRLPGGNGHGLN
jgi:methyl-accepting chemotaxis protein